jgi:signal transduction histidine kinase
MRFLHELVAGKVIQTERMEFKRIVTAWIDCFNNYIPLTDPRNIKVEIDTKTMNELPDVIASHLAAHQVIMNIYDNALKYGKFGTTITVRGKREGDFVALLTCSWAPDTQG